VIVTATDAEAATEYQRNIVCIRQNSLAYKFGQKYRTRSDFDWGKHLASDGIFGER